MFELEYQEIDTLMKIEHDKICDGYCLEATSWDGQKAAVWKEGVYGTISLLVKRKHRLDRMAKLYDLYFQSGQPLRLPTEVAMEILKFVDVIVVVLKN